MTTTTTTSTMNALYGTIDADITKHEAKAKDAMLTLESMKVSAQDYKKACRIFMYNHFITNYLKRVREVVETGDAKSSENLIRFHAHYQRRKGNLADGSEVAVAQTSLACILDGYINRFFEKED